MLKMKRSEQLARTLIEATHSGARMEYRRDQSVSVHDFDLIYPSGHIAAVEVTTSADQRMIEVWAAILERGQGPRIPAKRCRNSWFVHPLPHALINKVRADLGGYLADIETDGLDCFNAWTHAADYPSVQRIYNDLRIESGRSGQSASAPTPFISIMLPSGEGGFLSPEHVQRALEVEMNKGDNKQKLAASGTSERHLFVYVEPRNYLPWVSLVNALPSEEPPALPREITYIWAATETGSKDEFVVWSSQKTGWQRRVVTAHIGE